MGREDRLGQKPIQLALCSFGKTTGRHTRILSHLRRYIGLLAHRDRVRRHVVVATLARSSRIPLRRGRSRLKDPGKRARLRRPRLSDVGGCAWIGSL